MQVRSDNEEALKHVLKDACEQVHLECKYTRLETPASNGRGENSVRAMKEMMQRQKDAVFTLGIAFSIKHPLFALLVRQSEWVLNHLVCNDFLVELDNRVIKTSPHESHTGNLVSRSTSLFNRILVGRRDDDDKQPRFQQAWFLGLIAGSDEVIALHPDGVQRHHHGSWRVCPLDDLGSEPVRVEKCSCADDKMRLANTWLQDVSGCAVSQRLALCGMQRKSSPCNGI